MTDPSRAAAAAQALEALRQRYRGSAGTTVEAFRSLAARLVEQPDAPEVVETLRRELHRVRGTAGSYGYAEASRISGVLEERAVRWAADPRLELLERGAILLRYIAALGAAFDDGSVVASAGEAVPAGKRLLAVDLAPGIAESLREEGRLRGYEVEVKAEGAWTPAALRATAPHVVVTPLGSAEAVHAALANAGIPLVVLDDGSDPAAAKRAARLAGTRFAHAFEDAAAVFDLVTHAAGRTTWAGARVLVCDDDPDVLALVRAIVEDAGLEVRTLGDPARLLAELERTRPSLLLLDVNLGRIDGIALARTVRLMEGFATLPLILFSTQTDSRTRQAALDAGADEFLPKPIVAAELRARVTTRLDAERLRRLDEGRHPGTGLLLSDRLRSQLADQVTRRQVDRAPLAVAVLRPAERARTGGAQLSWHTEVRRVAEALVAAGPSRIVGYADDLAVAVVGPGSVDALATAVSVLQDSRPAGAPVWHAGVVAMSSTHEAADQLVAAATEAAGAAEVAGEPLRRWSVDDAQLAPDVIVVEDDVALADMLRYALDTQGFTHREYTTGTDALDALLAMRPGVGRRPLLLLDVELPGLDGHSLHERLRVQRPGVFAVVFASVHGSEGEQLRALRAGALDYIVKPVSLRVLMAKIPIWMAATRESRA